MHRSQSLRSSFQSGSENRERQDEHNPLNRSVHDQVSRSGLGLGAYALWPDLRLQDFAEFFAELCALHAPIAPMAPFYSVENITAPAFSPRLLTEGL